MLHFNLNMKKLSLKDLNLIMVALSGFNVYLISLNFTRIFEESDLIILKKCIEMEVSECLEGI